MSNSYDDSKFGVITRKFFGLTKKHGGDCASGYTFGTTDATAITHLSRFYPKGPLKLRKFGYYVLATIGGGGTGMDIIPSRLRVNGSNESSAVNIPTAGAPYSIGSTTTFTNNIVDAGSYLGVYSATPQSSNGTAKNTATSTGTVAFFVDYTPEYSTDGKWDT